jgi:HSP20 family protein
VKKEDVKVTMEAGMITVSGERRQCQEDKSEKFHRIESFRAVSRAASPCRRMSTGAAVRCESREGVLTVHLPKQAQKKPAPVEVKVS